MASKIMLLLHDEDELPYPPSDEEKNLASELGSEGLNKIDAALIESSKANWLKVARVITDAIRAGGFSFSEATVNLYARRMIEVVASGALECQGSLKKPRFSEVRIPSIKRKH